MTDLNQDNNEQREYTHTAAHTEAEKLGCSDYYFAVYSKAYEALNHLKSD